jgi:peptidoglycan/xylan/chitin deacetylase (PgdA/CDA1 family)
VPSLALTFDDGPDARCTGDLLDLLGAADARATFFPIATRAEAEPELVSRMLDEGHTVGLHCDEHVRHRERDRNWCVRDVDIALQRLRRIGVDPRLWRTPWGDVAPWTPGLAAARDLRLVGWTVDTHDWRGHSAAEMIAGTRAGLKPGAIVLAHDGIGPGARRPDARSTLEYARLVIEHAQESGLALEPLT